jgi:hypothetical protein
MTMKPAKSDLVRWKLALVPYNGITGEISWRRHIFVEDEGGASSRESFCETFYEALLAIAWLSPKVRRAVMAELGRSLREHNRKIEQGGTAALRAMIDERKEVLRKRRPRPRGGVTEQALGDIALTQGMTVPALKQRLKRNKRRQKPGTA